MIAFAHCLASRLGREITRLWDFVTRSIHDKYSTTGSSSIFSSTLPAVVVQPVIPSRDPSTRLPPPHSSRAFGSEDETRDDI
ncbi:hypothetical protein Dimus_036141, partial [Dionaea muscipula]